MSRAARRRAGRGGTGRSRGTFNKTPIWIMSGSMVAGLLVVALVAGPRGESMSHHPTPRAEAGSMEMSAGARYASVPGVGEVYEYAAEIPMVLDGMYCYCECLRNFNHYSLLECFMNDHAAGCDVCLREAIIAYQMTTQGETLDAIRAEVDRRYRT
jgi:hypothetical protein